MLLLRRYSELRRKKRRRNASLIFGDSGFSRSGGAKNRVKHLSQSSHKGRDLDVFRCIYSYLWLFIFYLPLFKNNLINQ